MSDEIGYVASSTLPVSVDEAFAYHDRPGALQRLIPPWENVHIEKSDQSLQPGSQVILKTQVAGIPLRWVAEHTHYDPPRSFADVQLSGPFRSWHHKHSFDPVDGQKTRLTDTIRYVLPAGAVGNFFGAGMARGKIESMFAYRHRVTCDDLALHAAHPIQPLTVAVSGSHGLVGSELVTLLKILGHRVVRLSRGKSTRSKPAGAPDLADDQLAVWDSDADAKRLADVDAVVHLAGKSIADSRWNDSVKSEIRSSRVEMTRQLSEKLASLDRRPGVLVCASATGIYGDRGDEILDESSTAGDDFLASVASEWEAACKPAESAGIRVVNARFGIVLSPRGGALAKMLTPAKMLGGALGSGDQWWSWIALDDVLGGLYHAITTPGIRGPMNFVAPEPIRNQSFAKVLGGVLGRPAIFPAPAFALRLGLGEMADSLLLASTRVIPRQLEASGYQFRFTELDAALRYMLGHVLRVSDQESAAESGEQACGVSSTAC